MTELINVKYYAFKGANYKQRKSNDKGWTIGSEMQISC